MDSAKLDINPVSFSASYDDKPLNTNDYETYVKAITNIASPTGNPDCSPGVSAPAMINRYENAVSLDTFAGTSSCNFTNFHNRFEIKDLLNNLNSNNKYLKGITISSAYTGPITTPITPVFYLNFTDCSYSGTNQIWFTNYIPKLKVDGKFDISDTLKIPIIRGGTIKYEYDDDAHTVDVFSIRNSFYNDRSRVKYSIDGFGNVMQKDIYTDESNVNSYKYKFNYLNKTTVNYDALNDS
ncbi:MAG: hypothetical protein LH629_14950, partial [Ignavibacteria bacterium]|nr:hypothetical protein [Ignavibacteria bacterium]